MALVKTDFDEVGGLWTSTNDLRRPPNTLRDCANVVFTENGRVSSRKGHPIVWSPASSETALKNNSWLGVFESPVSTDEKYIFYISSTTYALVARVDPTAGTLATNNAIRAYVSAPAGSPVESTPTTTEYTPGAVTASGYWKIPRSLISQQNTYVMASNGLFRAVQFSDNQKLKRVIPVSFAVFNPTLKVVSGREKEAWFRPGYKVAFRAIVKEQIADDGFVEWGDSGVIEVVNYRGHLFVEVDISMFVSNQSDMDVLNLEIYRTVQYLPSEPPPPNMFLAKVLQMSSATLLTVSGGIQATFTNTLLELGDDQVQATNRTLYFDADPELRNVTPPVAKEMVNFKGYTVYGNVTRPPIASLTLSDIPPSAAVLAVNDDGTDRSAAFADTSNATDVTSAYTLSTYAVGSTLGEDSFRGLSSAAKNFTIAPLIGSTASLVYGVPPQLSTTSQITTTVSGPSRIIKVVANGAYKDLTKFQAPGIFALTTSSGAVVDLISYTDFEVIPTSTRIEFQGCTSISSFAASPFSGAGTYYLYYLPGTSTNGLSVYARGTDASTADKHFSLLPTLIDYNAGEYIQYPVGRLVDPGYASSRINGKVEFFGIRARDAAARTLLAAQEWVKTYNAARAPLSPEAWWSIADNQIKLNFMNLRAGDHPAYVEGPQNFLELRKAAVDTYGTEPDIVASASSYTDILQYDTQVKNGLSISKLNTPEAVSLAQMVSPLRIGRDDRSIERIAVTEDALYVFKENEGVYRVDIAEGTVNPAVTGVILLDNTTWLVGPESVQEVSEAVYFLSNKGVARILGNAIEIMSTPIDTEIRSATTKAVAAGTTGSIRSFGNEVRKLYGVYIPGSTTYVLDTSNGMWGKWDLTPDNALVSEDGRLLTTDSLSWNYVRQDVYTTALDDATDQYDLEVALTGATQVTVGNTITFTRSTSTFLFGQIGTVADWATGGYLVIGGTSYSVTWAKTDANNLAVTFSTTPPTVTPASDKLYVGVRASVTSNKFWPTGPGSVAQFSKFYGYVTGQTNDVSLGFETDNVNPDFSGSTFVTFSAESDILTTLVPRCQGNGRWSMFKMTHSYPKQHFQLDGFSWLYRPVRNNRVERE